MYVWVCVHMTMYGYAQFCSETALLLWFFLVFWVIYSVCVKDILTVSTWLNVTQITRKLYIYHFLTKIGHKFHRNILNQSMPSASFVLCVIAETSLSLQASDGRHENVLHSPIQSESGLRTLWWQFRWGSQVLWPFLLMRFKSLVCLECTEWIYTNLYPWTFKGVN